MKRNGKGKRERKRQEKEEELSSPFDPLPDEIVLFLFSFLDVRGLVAMTITNKRLHLIAEESLLWDALYKR